MKFQMLSKYIQDFFYLYNRNSPWIDILFRYYSSGMVMMFKVSNTKGYTVYSIFINYTQLPNTSTVAINIL